MDRYYARSATVALCAALAGACGAASAQASAPAAAASPAGANSASDLPATLDGEIARAHLLRMKGEYAAASKALGQMLLVAPDDARVVGEYGKVEVQMGQPQTAIPFLKRAIELQPNDWSTYSALGVAFDQDDDHAAARIAYEHALSLKPGEPSTLNNFAVSCMLAGDLDGARRLFAEVAAAGANNPKIAANEAVLAGMKRGPGTAQAAAPRVTTTPVQVVNVAAPATGAPRTLVSAGVVMEKVPVDPLAGPVAHKPVPQHKLAQAKARKARLASAAKPTGAPPPPPVLRTAADAQ